MKFGWMSVLAAGFAVACGGGEDSDTTPAPTPGATVGDVSGGARKPIRKSWMEEGKMSRRHRWRAGPVRRPNLISCSLNCIPGTMGFRPFRFR